MRVQVDAFENCLPQGGTWSAERHPARLPCRRMPEQEMPKRNQGSPRKHGDLFPMTFVGKHDRYGMADSRELRERAADRIAADRCVLCEQLASMKGARFKASSKMVPRAIHQREHVPWPRPLETMALKDDSRPTITVRLHSSRRRELGVTDLHPSGEWSGSPNHRSGKGDGRIHDSSADPPTRGRGSNLPSGTVKRRHARRPPVSFCRWACRP